MKNPSASATTVDTGRAVQNRPVRNCKRSSGELARAGLEPAQERSPLRATLLSEGRSRVSEKFYGD